jgi:hypothetical protein
LRKRKGQDFTPFRLGNRPEIGVGVGTGGADERAREVDRLGRFLADHALHAGENKGM